MKYVLDSSVALKWVFPELDSDMAVMLRDGDHDFLAPEIFLVEIGHVLSKYVRQRKLTEAEATQALNAIRTDAPASAPAELDFDRAFQISLDTRCSFYDAFYVALAEREDCVFVTADDRLVQNLQARFKFLISLASLSNS